MKKITEIYAVVVPDEDGQEKIVSLRNGSEVVPLFGDNKENVKMMFTTGKMIAEGDGKGWKIRRFVLAEDAE